MHKFVELVFKTSVILCGINFANELLFSKVGSNNIIYSIIKMLLINFKFPLFFALIYWVYLSKIHIRLNNTSHVTGLDLWLISCCFAGIYIFIPNESCIRLLFPNLCVRYLWILTILALFYIAWLWRRLSDNRISDNIGIKLHVDKPAEVDEDELDRDIIADSITDTIENSRLDGAFVLAITGEWGEGKSTLMRFVQNKLDSRKKVTAYCFDPWYFNSQESLITNFFNSLYKKLNEKKIVLNSQIIFSQYSRIIGGKDLGIVGKTIDVFGQYSGQLEKIKCEIERCLTQHNKRVVIFIDNLDRLDRDELLLSFKLIRLCTDFPNVMFVLLYDKHEIYKILNADQNTSDKGFGQKYIEKIVQGEISLPIADPISIRKCWERLLADVVELEIDKLKNEEKLVWTEAVEHVSRKITNIRLAKLHTNWITLKMPHFQKNNLNFMDFFIIESIALFFPKAYKDIYAYSFHFPYYTQISLYWVTFDKNKIIENRKKCYKDICSAYSGLDLEVLQNLLSMLFTSCRNFFNENDDLYGGEEGAKNYYNDRPIDDQRYFNSYFSYTPTPQLIIAKALSSVLQEIAAGVNNPEENTRLFSNLVIDLNTQGSIVELLIHLKQNLNELNVRVFEPIVKAISLNSRLYSDENNFMSISDRSRAQYLVVNLIVACPDKPIAQSILEYLTTSCDDYSFVRAILYHLEKENLMSEVNINDVKNIFVQRITELLEKNHNFFIPPEFSNDFWAVIDYTEKTKISEYLHRILSEELNSLPGFLKLLVQRSISSSEGIKYSILNDYYNMFDQFVSFEEIDDWVDKFIKKNPSGPLPNSITLYKAYRQQLRDIYLKPFITENYKSNLVSYFRDTEKFDMKPDYDPHASGQITTKGILRDGAKKQIEVSISEINKLLDNVVLSVWLNGNDTSDNEDLVYILRMLDFIFPAHKGSKEFVKDIINQAFKHHRGKITKNGLDFKTVYIENAGGTHGENAIIFDIEKTK